MNQRRPRTISSTAPAIAKPVSSDRLTHLHRGGGWPSASVQNVCRPLFWLEIPRVEIAGKLLILFGERAGARTQDPVIKSHVLYRLSYGLVEP